MPMFIIKFSCTNLVMKLKQNTAFKATLFFAQCERNSDVFTWNYPDLLNIPNKCVNLSDHA